MGKTNVNWDDPETWQRVVAAIVASGVKIDIRQIATLFGTTYDTLENRFRKIKKLGVTLKEEVVNGERGEVVTPTRRTKSTSASASATSTPRKTKTPRKHPLSAVSNGRISKPTPKSKKATTIVVKREMDGEDDDDDDDLGSLAGFGMNGDLNFDFLGDDGLVDELT